MIPFPLRSNRFQVLSTVAFSVMLAAATVAAPPETPRQEGDPAPDFALNTLDGTRVDLRGLTRESRVVLVVLRGWPGYQCPICSRQVQDFIAQADEFARRGARVVMIYPGPAEQLREHAKEFLENKQWPPAFLYVTDPDYTFTHAYGLRWSAPRETAYPSTFIVDRANIVRFAKVSRTHGGRTSAREVIDALDALTASP